MEKAEEEKMWQDCVAVDMRLFKLRKDEIQWGLEEWN